MQRNVTEVSVIPELVKRAAKFLRKQLLKTESGHEGIPTEKRKHYLAAFCRVLVQVFESTHREEEVLKQLVE